MPDTIPVRTGQAPPGLGREEFARRFQENFSDPRFDAERESIDRLEAIAWSNYRDARKAPRTQKAGAGFADPDYDLSVEWLETRNRLIEAARERAKQIEMKGWDYPKHLAGRAYGLIVHGDVAGIEGTRRALSDWLNWMGLIDAGVLARLDCFIGYYEPYATSHEVLDHDETVQEEVRNVARAVAAAVSALRKGELSQPDRGLTRPRPK